MPTKTKYYRNLVEIQNCEPDSLWVLRGDNYLQLVDDDEHVMVTFEGHEDKFYEVPVPYLE